MTSSASCAMGLLSQYKPGAGGAEARGAVMEAGLLSAILGLVTVQGETAMLDLDLQKVAFLSDVGRSSDSGPSPSNPQPIPEQIQQGPQDPPGSAWTEQIAGFWREVGVASSQNLALKTPKRLEALFLTLSGHELLVKAAYYSSGSCETENIVGSEIDMSGTFVFPGHREIQVVDTDYEQYAILRLSLHWQGKDFRVLKYFTRSLEDENGPGFWRFRELTADTGLYLVARHGRCAKLLKEGSSDCRADQPRARPGVGNLPGTCWIES
ncbi:epididymal-specific lipocalin-8 isoform X1 [Canis lupus familiaris]|uniref:epididymal-specific lipocalin-8 isoform X1 n=1 Tax=Canis lupus familiaris TaxID=9615 RepID=UPI0018F445F4|nr:epididymal-specific lipocalin-8 isoform X1 [Canis lupus familiaris]